jgi:hypothetical protein
MILRRSVHDFEVDLLSFVVQAVAEANVECYSERQNLSKNLDSSFLSVNEQGNIIPKTPEAALVAAQTYLYTTRPSPRDLREHMHREHYKD